MLNKLQIFWKGFICRLTHPLIWAKWYIKGKRVPAPEIIKRHTIKNLFGNEKIFIETGTYMGDMVEQVKKWFKQIYSIEIQPELAEKARVRFFSDDKNIKILCGDSAELLPGIINQISEPCAFWLDGHYSGGPTGRGELETPIIKELTTIFNHPIKNHTILIDDARLFIGEKDYPTITELSNFVKENSDYNFYITRDIIVLKK